jgi:hypothetical protein
MDNDAAEIALNKGAETAVDDSEEGVQVIANSRSWDR